MRSPSARSTSSTRHANRSFFLWTTYVAPHTGGPIELDDPVGYKSTVPAPRHYAAFAGTPLPRPPSFNERNVADKPALIRKRPRLAPWQIAAITETRRQRLAALLAVDEGVTRIVETLRATGVLANTVVIFTSDNGWMAGEHRVPSGKMLAYEPSIRVPLLMRGPGIPAGVRRSELVWNGDLAPTILALTGAQPAWPLDGRSLLAPARTRAARSCSRARPRRGRSACRASPACARTATSTSSTCGAPRRSTTCGATRTSSRTSPGYRARPA